MNQIFNLNLTIKFDCCNSKFLVTSKWHNRRKGTAYCFHCNDEDKSTYKVIKEESEK